MTWFKVDDRLHSHPKIRRAGTEAVGFWVICGSYCADHLTDGFVSRIDAIHYAGGSEARAESLASRLVDAGLWEVVDGGWRFTELGELFVIRGSNSRNRMPIRKTVRQKVIQRDGMICRLCGGAIESGDVHIDHIVPVANGGRSELSNLQVAHSKCNIKKGRKNWPEVAT